MRFTLRQLFVVTTVVALVAGAMIRTEFGLLLVIAAGGFGVQWMTYSLDQR
jgi:hypothetical protein